MADKITLWIIAGTLALMGIVMLLGKGDWMISGYNTASAEERAQYNIHRLRLVMGITAIIIGAIMAIAPFFEPRMIILIAIIPITIPALILSNTWAKN